MTELDTIVRWVVPLLLAIIAFFIREMVEQVKKIGDKVQKHAESLSAGNQRFSELERRVARLEAEKDVEAKRAS